MNQLISYWVALITIVCMSVTVTVTLSKGMVHEHEQDNFEVGKKWALLVAGSKDYQNYRHQANICHAYHILKSGGLEDENIIVFMYDDIAYHPQNSRPGVIINRPDGPNVYPGVPKDYTGNHTNAINLFAVLNGNLSGITGGSGKVLKSGPNDTIFIYYSGHGYPGLIGMADHSIVYANDFVDALKDKHATNSYKKMVIYVEACYSASLFEGLLPNNISIYVTTSANAHELGYGFYCPDDTPLLPAAYTTCLGDMFGISWMEDSEINDRRNETLQQQYITVRNRTISYQNFASHVTQLGDLNISSDFLVTYIGAAPRSNNVSDNYNLTNTISVHSSEPFNTSTSFVSEDDAYLLHLRLELQKALDGSKDKLKAQKELDAEIAERKHVYYNIHLIGNFLFGENNSSIMMFHVRPTGQPLVDDWNCFKILFKTYESHCGILSTYGRKYSRAFAYMCNVGISEKLMIAVVSQVCPGVHNSS